MVFWGSKQASFGKIFLFCLLFLSHCKNLPIERIELEGTWNYVWGREMDKEFISEGPQDWNSFYFPGLPPGREEDKYLLIRGKLDNRINSLRDPGLYLHIVLEDFKIFLDGKEIYSFGSLDNRSQQIPSYVHPHVIPLPSQSGGKEIRIIIHSGYRQFIGVDHFAYIANLVDIKESMLIYEFPMYVLSGVYLLIAMTSLLIYILTSKNKIFLYYSLLVFANSGITIFSSYFPIYYFSHSGISVYIYNIFLYFIPVSFFLYVSEVLKNSYRKIFRLGIIFYSIIGILFYVSVLIGKTSFINIENFFNALVIPGIFFLFFSIGKQALRGDIDSRLMFTGIVAAGLFAMHDFMKDFGLFNTHFVIYSYGIFIFIIFQGLILFRRIYSIQKNYELKENELLVAQKIQNSILPDLPQKIGNWELESYYQPMKEVGGDFYDYQVDENGNIGFLILDVSGHGVGASIIASMAKVSFSHCFPILHQPDQVLNEMNQSLIDKINHHFATAFYISIKENSSVCQFSSAGHPSGLLISHLNNDVMEFRTKSKPLGIQKNHKYSKSYIYLKEGDLICLYTDGIIELINPEMQEYGEERLKELLLKFSLLPLHEIKRNLIQDLKLWSLNDNISQDDDLSLLLLRYNSTNIQKIDNKI